MYTVKLTNQNLVLENMVDPMVVDKGGTTDVVGSKVICDGLLCSILHAMSHVSNKDEFISVVERDCDEQEILAAREKLFKYFSDVICDKQKKPILDITRSSVRKNIEDILEQMRKVDKTLMSQIFFMPWDYAIKPFKGDTEIRADLMEKDLGIVVDSKIESLKNEMRIKNQAIMELIHNKFNEVIQHVSSSSNPQSTPSYASVASHGKGEGHHSVCGSGQSGQGRDQVQRYSGSIPTLSFTSAVPPLTAPGQDSRRGMGQQDGGQWDRLAGDAHGRSRSGSANKRRRGENGPIQDRSPSSNSRQKRVVVGTCSSNQAGRKMRSPPADIFVYGVHPDTSPEDIVQDLAFSDIIIKAEDIVKKSKDEAFLKSYKISVKAEDLLKALDPAIWPMRVKVREFIHYSRRPGREGQGYQQQHGRVQAQGGGYQHQQGQGYHHGRVYQHQQGHSGQTPGGPIHQGGEFQQAYSGRAHVQHAEPVGVGGPPAQFLAPNKYALPEDNVPGGVRHDV